MPTATPKQITVWFDYVSKNFAYRSAWGLGGLIAIVVHVGWDLRWCGKSACKPIKRL